MIFLQINNNYNIRKLSFFMYNLKILLKKLLTFFGLNKVNKIKHYMASFN